MCDSEHKTPNILISAVTKAVQTGWVFYCRLCVCCLFLLRLICTSTIFFKLLIGQSIFPKNTNIQVKKRPYYFSGQGPFFWAFAPRTKASTNHDSFVEKKSLPSPTVEQKFTWLGPCFEGTLDSSGPKTPHFKNQTILNKRNVPTRWITTSWPGKYCFLCDYYTQGRIGAFSRSLSTAVCVDLRHSYI